MAEGGGDRTHCSREGTPAYKAGSSHQLVAFRPMQKKRKLHHGSNRRPGKDVAIRAFVFSPNSTVNLGWNQAIGILIFLFPPALASSADEIRQTT
jgi:hypothetical protein